MEKLPNSSNEFQLEIDKFNSKTAIISVPYNLSGSYQ